MLRISRDFPCLYLTAVTKDRLPVFRTEAIKVLACAALNEARKSSGLLILAYVIMPDHLHVVTGGDIKPSDALRFIKGIASRRIIDHLKQPQFAASLKKLQVGTIERNHRYALWEHHSNVVALPGETLLMQKVTYTHQNPVRLRLVERPEDYRWSSARYWSHNPNANEPLVPDLDQIAWRAAAGRA
jgi:putative transposase